MPPLHAGVDRRLTEPCRWSFYNIAVRSTPDTMNMLYNSIAQNADALLLGVNCSVGSAVQPVTASHLRAARALGGDAIDLDPEKGNFVSKFNHSVIPHDRIRNISC